MMQKTFWTSEIIAAQGRALSIEPRGRRLKSCKNKVLMVFVVKGFNWPSQIANYSLNHTGFHSQVKGFQVGSRKLGISVMKI